MRWLRRLLLLVVVGAGLAVVAVLGPLRGPAVEVVRERLEPVLAAALHEPATIGALRLSLVPFQVEADDVVLGVDGALARCGHLAVHLLPRTSLRQLRPVATATADDLVIDIPRGTALLETPSATPATPIPPFRLRAVQVTHARVRIAEGDEPFDVQAGSVAGELEATILGRLHFAADAREVVLARRGATLALQRLAARGGETAEGWRLAGIEAEGDGVQLASSPAAGDRLPIRGRVALPRLSFASEVFERLDGELEIDAALLGRLDQPAAAGKVQVANLIADGEPIGDVSASAEWNLHTLTLSSARLDGFGGSADARGTLALAAPFAWEAELDWSSLDGRQLAHLTAPAIKPFAASGQATLSGTLEPLAVRGEGDGTVRATAGGEPVGWRGGGYYGAGAGAGEIDATQARVNTVRARVDVSAGGALDGALDAAVGNAAALGAFVPIESVPDVRGTLTATAQLAGTIGDPRLTGDVAGRGVTVLGVSIDRLGGSFAVDRRTLRATAVTAQLWQGSIAASGVVALDAAGANDWQVRVTNVPGDAAVAIVSGLTGSVPPIGRGTLNVQLDGHGPWPRVRLDGSATLAQFWLGPEWIRAARLTGSATWPRWQLDGELQNRAGQAVTLHAGGSALDDLALDAHSAGWDLTAVQRGELVESGGGLALDASLRGPLRGLSGRVAFQAHELVIGGLRLGTVTVDGEATRGRWQLSATVPDGALTLRGSLAPDAGAPFTLQGEWTDANFAHLLAPESDVHVDSTGTLQISGRLAALEQFDATVRVQALRIRHDPYEVSLAPPAVLECRRGACTLAPSELRGPDTDLRASGTFAATGAVRVTLTGQGDLRLLEIVNRSIESARGRFTVEADVQRSGGRWDIAGQMTFDDAALDVGGPAITRASGRLVLAGTTVRIDRLGGRMGSGTFAIGGAIDLVHGPDLTWTLTGVATDLMPSLEVEASGQGTLSGPWERLRLAGEIDVARLLYDRRIEFTDLLPSFNRALAAAPREPSAAPLEIDLHVVAPGELYVENNLARIEGRADLRITGTAQHPVLDGRVEALDGTITFRRRTFELLGATVDFRPDLGLAAALNISAESTIDTPDATYIVGVRVTGTTADPRVALTSDDPSLSQTDIATLIAVGQTAAQLREGGGSFSMYDALSLVPTQLTEGVTKSATHLLPIDRITFEPTFSRATGTFEPQLKLGKDLTDDLALSVGQTFGVESRTTVQADYRLSQTVFIPVSWESQTSTQEGAFAAGVKVRYEFWRLTPYTLLGGLH